MDEFLSSVSELFLGNGIIISLACLTVGMFLKGTFKKFPNKYIPFSNVVVAIIAGFAIPGTYDDKDPVSKVIILAFLGLSSVGLYESLCIIVKKRFDIDIAEIISHYGSSASDPKTGESSNDVLLDATTSEEIEETVDQSEDDVQT